MIKAVIFDIGRVLMTYDWDAYFGGLFDGDRKKMKAVRDAFFENGIWDEVDRGVWPDEKLMEAFVQVSPGFKEELQLAWDRLGTAMERFSHTDGWIESLHERGYEVYYLSNWSHHLLKQAEESLRFTEKMDGGIFSCKVGKIKPDPAIYEMLMEKYGLLPEECVFIDDKRANTDAAKALGMQVVTFKDYEQASEELEKILSK